MIRLVAAVGLLGLAFAGEANAQMRHSLRGPDARQNFIRQCTVHMAGRWAHPVSVCGCLHDHAAAAVADADLRLALLRGIGESGVPRIDEDWVPAAKQDRISETFTAIARPALQCLFEPEKAS